ncbi:MAG: MBL fold metallo-hydrolase [Devosia sp.]|uniref:MBL fold metallo-hydrolase n=1 Tax=Devosia sp. TaxID=1871048 RepID=UPI001A4DC8A1|nr:MBL fold metallo-hydrolase [Devosia sp.]MBL8596583.1 MBL fold metallo-hydrolase [Devosia sp.]
MADASPPALAFDTDFAPETGHPVDVLPGVVRLTAPNPGPFTFTGTNSFLLGGDRLAILDPGPDDAAHRAALLAAAAGRRVEAIILTHTHKDHSAGADALRQATGAPLWFAGPHRLSRPLRRFEANALAGDCDWDLVPDRTLRDGETFTAGDLELVATATPGHCANHMGFGLAGTGWLLTGDHIMGWNSTLVAVPDGSMADYLASLEKVLALPHAHYLPAHGGPIADGPAYARALLAHRQLRNRQIADAVAAGATTIGGLLDRIYPQLTARLRFAAALTLRAHIEYLAERGLIRARRTLFGLRLSPP